MSCATGGVDCEGLFRYVKRAIKRNLKNLCRKPGRKPRRAFCSAAFAIAHAQPGSAFAGWSKRTRQYENQDCVIFRWRWSSRCALPPRRFPVLPCSLARCSFGKFLIARAFSRFCITCAPPYRDLQGNLHGVRVWSALGCTPSLRHETRDPLRVVRT